MSKLAINGGPPVRTAPWPAWPVHDEAEEAAVLEVVRSGNWWRHSYGEGATLAEDESNSPSRVVRFQRAFARAHDCDHGIAAANGTVTLEIALRAAGVAPGDEVIVPAYTFIATATAPLMIGAIPIFLDIDPDTYNLDTSRLEEAITPRTRAVIPVHFGGQPCDMDAIAAVAEEHGLAVIEDAAHAHGASYRQRKCGSLGDLGSFSFQASKNMTAGEGGIITTNNPELADACASLVWGGRREGEPWYRHFVLASNARMTEFQGAILLAQLARLEDQAATRTANAAVLTELLGDIPGIEPLRRDAATTAHANHLYIFRYNAAAFQGAPRTRFVEALAAEGIASATGGYEAPLYANPVFVDKRFFGGAYPLEAFEHGRSVNYRAFAERCPVSERACAGEAVWLTQSMLLGNERDMHDIAGAIHKVQEYAEEL